MKTILVFLTILSLSLCGHLYVEDLQLKWQNKGELNQITVRFSLQSGLGKSDVLRLGLPFTWADPSTAVLAQGATTLSSKGATSGPVVTTSFSGNNIFASFGVALSANVWYSLTISGAVASVDEKCYESPVTLQTQSTSGANAIVYDENLSAGQICVSEEVSVLKNLQVSISKTKLAVPNSLDANNVLEAVYTIYIDLQTTKDYLGGAFIRYEITNSFTFNGNCASESNTCVASGATGFDATCVNVTTADTGSCTAELVNGVATGNYIQEHVGALRQSTWRRIKIDIKNPSFYVAASNTGSVRVYLYSRVRDVFYYYEKKVDLAAQFQVNQISIDSLAVLLFWGIAVTDAPTFGCPVQLYKDSDYTSGQDGATAVLKIWNKVQVYFAVKASFPSLSSATYTVTVNINQADGVALGSINTNLPKKDSAKSLTSTCQANTQTAASSTISCSNIGAPTVATYWFVASVHIPSNAAASSGNFGKVEISSQRIINAATNSLSTIQVSSTGSNGQSIVIRKNDEYTKGLETVVARNGLGPQVISFTAGGTPDYTQAGLHAYLGSHLVTANSAAGASDILIPTTGSIDLLFIISAQQDQLCCTKKSGVSGPSTSFSCLAAQTSCSVADGTEKAQTLLKVFANPNVFATTDATFLNNGVRVLNWGLFNNLIDSAQTGPCTRAQFCGTYETDKNNTVAAQTAGKWYNIWQVKASAAVNGIVPESILHLTFLCGDVTKVVAATKSTLVCAQSTTLVYDGTTAANSRLPGFVWHSVNLNTGFLGNPLYPSKFELDFIVCFRFEAGSTGKTNHGFVIETAEQTLASSGVVHATAYHKGFDVATIFRVNVFNVARITTTTSFNDFSVVPIFLRVGGNIAGSDWKANTGAAVFLDQYIDLSGSRPIDAAYFNTCASSTDAAILCEESNSFDTNDNFYYYPVQRRIVLRSTISSATEFNHYLPANFKGFTFRSLSLVLVNADSVGGNYLTQRAFKVFGYAQQKSLTLYYFTGGDAIGDPAASPSYINTATGADNAADAQTQALRSLGVTQGAANAVNNHPQKGCTPNFILQASGTAVTPLWGGFSLATGTYDVNAKITGCAVAATQNPVPAQGTAGDGLVRINNAKWGAHFQVTASQVKFWAGSKLTWDLAQTAQPKSDCLEYTYKPQADNRVRYVIICPADQGASALALTDNRLLKLDKFTVPFYVGGATAGAGGPTTGGQAQLLGYVWSDIYGAVKGYLPQAGDTRGQDGTAGTACTHTAYTSIWVPSGNAQKVTFSVKITQNILLNQNTNQKWAKVIPTLSASSALNPTYINNLCLVNWANVDCALDSTTTTAPVFTLTSTNTATTFSDAYTGDTSISFWVSTGTGTDTTTTYTVKVQATNPAVASAGTEQLVNHCSTAAAWQAGTTAYGATVTSITSTFPLWKKVQGTISVKWTINKTLYSFQSFKLSLGFLGLAQASVQGKNTKCNLYSGDNYDFDYETSTAETALDTVTINLRNDKTLQYAYSSKQNFEFRCVGAFSPENAIVAADNIKVDWLQSQANGAASVAFGFDTGFRTGLTTAADRTTLETLAVPTLDALTSVTFTTTVARTWNDLGQEADYTFTTVVAGNYTVDSGTWVVVEFTRAIAPRLNRRGVIHCDTGFNTTLVRAYCEFVGDRRVRFLVNQRLLNSTLNPAGYKFVVHHVRLPAAYIQSYDQIYWALYDRNQATLLKHAWLKDATIGTVAPGPLRVLEYSVSTNLTRSTATLNFLIQIPTGLVKLDQELFVLFPGEYNDAFYKGFTPSCTLNRQLDDWSGQDSTNYVNNCSYFDGLRVRAFLKLDSANAAAAKAYRLSISGVPTPHDPSPGWSAPQIQIPNLGTTTIARQSCAGYSNASYAAFGADSTKNYIEWQNAQVSARVGVYSGSAAFVPPAGKKSFTEDITLTTSTSAFSFSPTTFVVAGGSKISSFRFAPKSTTSPGLQFIDFATGKDNYAPLKPLQVQVLAEQCQIVNDASYTFPYGATSLPYVISFEQCQPETSVVLKISALNVTATSLDNLGKGFDSRNFTIDSTGTAASFEVKFGGVQQISFQLKSTDQTTTALSPVGKLVFSWESSPNQNSYTISTPVATVSSTVPDVQSSQLTLAANPAAGQVTLAFTCDKAAIFYYAVGTNNATLSSLTYTNIKAATLDLGLSQTWPDAANDQIHGYAIARTGNTQQSVVITRVRSLASYFAVGICVNPSANVTTGSTKYTNWTQTDNNGRPSTVNITFSDSLSTSQEQSTCNALAVALAQSCNMTVCSNQNNACGTSAYSSTTSTTTATTNTTANATTTTNTTNSTSGAKRRRVLQNSTNTTNTTTVQTIQNCTSYQNNLCLACNGSLLVALGGGSCLSVCPSGQVASAGKCIVSTKRSYYYAILPNPYGASDTTYADVQSALADKASFNTVFRARASLGNLTYDDPVLLDPITGTLQRPVLTVNITAPSAYADFPNVTFSAVINGTDGWIFVAIADGQSLTKPTLQALRANTNNYRLRQQFVKNGQRYQASVTLVNTTLNYTAFYAATNQDPIRGLGTEVQSTEFRIVEGTVVDTTFGSNISVGILAMLVLIFALFIMI